MRGTGTESLVVVMKSLSWRWSEGATSGGLVRIQLGSPGGDADEGTTICHLQAGTAGCQVCSPDGSGMSREVHVPFYERLGVQFPRPTHRFGVSFRDVEDLLAQRGLTVSYEAIRLWCITFGAAYARRLKRRQGRLGDTWHLDEVFVTIQGRRHYCWRAVDQDGDVLDILVQSHRDCRAATRFFRKLLKGQERQPVRLVTDKLRSDRAAHRAVMPSVAHRTDRYENNRAEVSHQPTRQRERQMRRFKSAAHAQRILSVHGLVLNLFRVGRHLLRSAHHRVLRMRAFAEWDAVTCAC